MREASRRVEAPEYAATARALLAHLPSAVAAPPSSGIVIAVAGESGSGKTVTAAALARALEERGVATALLHQDDYFRLPPRANHEQRRRDLAHVGPHEVDLPRMQEQIAAFRARRPSVRAPLVDYPSDRFLEIELDLATPRVLIVEGTYVLMLDDVDVRIFLAATHEDTRARREARARDLHEPFVDDVLRIEHRLVAAQAARADLVLDREFRIEPRATGR